MDIAVYNLSEALRQEGDLLFTTYYNNNNNESYFNEFVYDFAYF